MSARSRNEADVLSASLRAKPLLLGALCVGAVVAAAGTWVTEKGRGEAERPDRVFVVSEDFVDYDRLLGGSGFLVRSGTLREWEHEARQVLDDEELSGVEAVVALADERGAGFVVFGQPGEVSGLDQLELSSESDEIEGDTAYASLSIGDLAFPHELRVNPPASEVVEFPGFSALEALFAQPRFDPEREVLVHKPAVEELQLAERLSSGTKMLARARGLEETVARIEAQIVETRDAGGGLSLAGPLDSGGALPLPDGSFLSIVQRVELFSRDAISLEYRGGEHLRLTWRASLSDDPEPCEALFGGSIPVADHPRVSVSPDVSTLMIDVDDHEPRIFRFTPFAETRACPFTEVARLSAPSVSGWERRWSLVPGSSMAARVEGRSGSSRLHLDSFVDNQGIKQPLRFDLPNVELGEPVWVGARRLAALGRYWPDQAGEALDSVYLFDVDAPHTFTRLDASSFSHGERLAQLASSAHGRLVVSAGPDGEWLFVIDLHERAWAKKVEPGEVDGRAQARERGGESPTLGAALDEVPAAPGRSLEPEVAVVRGLDLGGATGNLGTTPDGSLVTFTHAQSRQLPEEVAVLRLGTPLEQPELGPAEFLTNDGLRDVRPRLSADGSMLVFRTHVPVSVSDRFVSVPRAIVLGSGSGG